MPNSLPYAELKRTNFPHFSSQNASAQYPSDLAAGNLGRLARSWWSVLPMTERQALPTRGLGVYSKTRWKWLSLEQCNECYSRSQIVPLVICLIPKGICSEIVGCSRSTPRSTQGRDEECGPRLGHNWAWILPGQLGKSAALRSLSTLSLSVPVY